VLLRHLALSVSDPHRSAAFYLHVIGLEGEAREESWGCRVMLSDGFMLALIEGDPLPNDVVGRVHFGCALASPGAARALRERLRDAGVREVEWEDAEVEESYVGLKVADPDGYVVELSYDVS